MSKAIKGKTRSEKFESNGIVFKIYHSPIGNRESYELVYKDGLGSRKKQRFSSKDAAKDAASRISKDILSGTRHVAVLRPDQVANVQAAARIVGRFPGVKMLEAVQEWAAAREELAKLNALPSASAHKFTLLQAIHHFVEDEGRRAIREITFPALVDEYLGTLKGYSQRYREDMTSRLKQAKKAFNVKLTHIETRDIEAWLNSMKVRSTRTNIDPRTRNNFRTTLTTIFSYAKANGYLPETGRTAAEKVKKAEVRPDAPAIYTPEELEMILSKIDEAWVPFVAIAAFAGIRSAELHRLNWKDVWLDRKVIDISASNAKTPSNRRPPILPNLHEWLAPYAEKAKKDQSICPRRYTHDSTLLIEFAKAAQKTGVPTKRNGFRHSYGTYRLAVTQHPSQVAFEMGNSARMLFAHYQALATPEEGKAWFSIMPTVRSLSPKQRATPRKKPSRGAAG